MLGKLIGAAIGQQAARHIGGVNGTGGALLGLGAAAVLRRLGPAGLIVAAAGSYALKRHRDRAERRAATAPLGGLPGLVQ
jgi:hypothetical protein